MGKSSGSFAAANSGIKKGPWTPEEDSKLLAFIQLHGHGSWRSLPQKAGLKRCGKSCRLRWRNYLRPDIKRGNFSLHEDRNIIQLHALLGNRWSTIAKHLPKRTDNEIKNYWNTHLKKRLAKIGFDPVTHKPMTAILGSADGDPKNLSNLSHIAQWESARLQAEARFVKESKQRQYEITAAPPPPLVSHEAPSLGPPQHFVPQCNTSAWENLIFMSSSTAAPATTNCNINGQDDNVVSFGNRNHQAHHVDVDICNVNVDICNVNVNFDAPAFDQCLPGMMEHDGITTTGSSPLDIGNECSELLAAFYQHNMAS